MCLTITRKLEFTRLSSHRSSAFLPGCFLALQPGHNSALSRCELLLHTLLSTLLLWHHLTLLPWYKLALWDLLLLTLLLGDGHADLLLLLLTPLSTYNSQFLQKVITAAAHIYPHKHSQSKFGRLPSL